LVITDDGRNVIQARRRCRAVEVEGEWEQDFANGQAPSIGHFYGKIVDAKTGKGMDGVSIQLIQSNSITVTRKRKDTVIAGMITGRKGDFSMENLPISGTSAKDHYHRLCHHRTKSGFEMKMTKGGDMQQALNAVDKTGQYQADRRCTDPGEVTVTASKP